MEPYGIENAASKYVDLSTKTIDGKTIVDIIYEYSDSSFL